jgi:hypothetical protein
MLQTLDPAAKGTQGSDILEDSTESVCSISDSDWAEILFSELPGVILATAEMCATGDPIRVRGKGGNKNLVAKNPREALWAAWVQNFWPAGLIGCTESQRPVLQI